MIHDTLARANPCVREVQTRHVYIITCAYPRVTDHTIARANLELHPTPVTFFLNYLVSFPTFSLSRAKSPRTKENIRGGLIAEKKGD